MSDVTKKEVRDLIESISLGCPGCNARLSLDAYSQMVPETRRVLRRALIDGLLTLNLIEESLTDIYDGIDTNDEAMIGGLRDSQQYAKGGS